MRHDNTVRYMGIYLSVIRNDAVRTMVETLSDAYPKKIAINKKWCKGCGICAALCPKVLAMNTGGKAVVVNQSLCTGCRRCESHCPDFAISLKVDSND